MGSFVSYGGMKKGSIAAWVAAGAACGAALLFMAGCGDNDDVRNFAYLRSASDFGVDTALTEAGCSDPQPAFHNDAALCRSTRKFILHWERPEDTAGFLGYRIYLDTSHAGQKWPTLQNDDSKAAAVILDVVKGKDSLVFFLTSETKKLPDTVRSGDHFILAIDSNTRSFENTFVFALATRYSDGGTPGQPRYTQLITNDKFPPNPFDPLYEAADKTITITWRRPLDPVSIFNPGLDSGLIRGYVLGIKLDGAHLEERVKGFDPHMKYWVGGEERTKEETDSSLHHGALVIGKEYFLPDSNRAHKFDASGKDSLRVVLSNLHPSEILDLYLFAVDSTGNTNSTAMQDIRIHTTDTTRPSRPRFRDPGPSVRQNSFTVEWTPSRDSAETGGDAPDFLIREYRLARIQLRDSAGKPSPLDRFDTIITVNHETPFADSVHRLSFTFLPPGTSYHLSITALDSSGFESEADTVDVATLAIRFSGAESTLTCPPGFVPIPANNFPLGDTAQVAQGDEKPSRKIHMGSYCIEPYEHRDSTGGKDSLGRFVSAVTWDEADSVCRMMSPADSTALCSEAEWERACEGFDSIPHQHGIQSETSPAILQASCNEATGDSAMAMNLALRNGVCLTNEGVYDMAGNLSEWVRDPYVANAYQSLRDPDTLGHSFSFAPPAGTPADSIRRAFRGSSYLKPDVPLAQAQNLARCSNRDFAEQIRPLFRSDCLDSASPKLAVIYGSGLNGFRCQDLPGNLRNATITDVVPGRGRDSLNLFIFTAGSSKVDTAAIDQGDSTIKGKRPFDATLTTRALAEVVFVNSVTGAEIKDFIDAKEMRDTSQAALERIFRRESPSSSWSVKKTGGRYDIRLWYAHTIMGSLPAKPYYASRAIGFRCCSKARAALSPPVAGD
jgi:formylglycine-generating enzyme required for sulfatase activity